MADTTQGNPSLAEQSGALAEHYKSKHVLVTGGFGFLAGALISRLLLLGARVTALDIDTSETRDSFLNLGPDRQRDHVRIVTGNVGDAALMKAVIHGEPFDTIFHLAAYAVIEKSALFPLDTIQANTMGFVYLLEAIRSLEPGRARPSAIVFSSTDKVYGEMESQQYSEQTPLRGVGLYDAAKLSADVFAQTYHEVFGLPTVVIRLCNIFGPCDFNINYRLVPKALKSIYESAEPRAPMLFFDSIEHWRDYLYIDDAVRALLLLGYHPQCRGEVFNAAASGHKSTPEMLRSVVELSAKCEQEYDPVRAEQILRNGIGLTVRPESASVLSIKRQHLDGAKIRRVAGFEPQVGLNEGLTRTIGFYRDYFARRRRGET